jgi:hypothetical protein
MLASNPENQLTIPRDVQACRVVLPAAWTDFFERRGPQLHYGADNRRFIRTHFPTQALMELPGTHPSIPREFERHVVLMKDISRQGVGFLHSAQLYPGERVTIIFPTGRRDYMIVRCLRHNDLCFEVGAELVATR